MYMSSKFPSHAYNFYAYKNIYQKLFSALILNNSRQILVYINAYIFNTTLLLKLNLESQENLFFGIFLSQFD
jgi:hypothetical protein